MTVRLYLSTDASAPSLTGTVGSLVALLDAVLVNGYGSQIAAGWTKAFSAINKASYRQGAGSCSFYLDVDDSGPGGGGAKEARFRGYETMTAVATGTNPFPTTAQQATVGVVCRKSNTADATARAWYIVADSTVFYIFVDTGDYTGPAYSMSAMFGNFFSYKSGDAYNCAIMGRNSENSGSDADEYLPLLAPTNLPLTNYVNRHYLARTWTGVGGCIQFALHTSLLAGQSSGSHFIPGGSLSTVTYPNGPDGALELAPIWVGHNGHVRGYLKGLWCPLHNQPTGHADTFTGSGNMNGKSFIALNVRSSAAGGGSPQGQLVLETSDTWS